MPGERRRDYTVSRPVQLVYALTWSASIALLLALAMLIYTSAQLNAQRPLEPASILGVNGFLLLSILAVVLVVIALGLCLLVVVHTHRMVGASYRIRQVIEELRAGNWSCEVVLRDGDHFLDVADSLNALIREKNVAAQEVSNSVDPEPPVQAEP